MDTQTILLTAPLLKLVSHLALRISTLFLLLCASSIALAAPDVPTAIEPVNETVSSQPDFSWQHEQDALKYVLMVVDRSTQERVHWQTHNQEDICSSTTCSYTPDIELGFSNQHVWFVRSWNPTGASAWAKSEFAVKDELPSIPVPVSPLTVATTAQPEFVWQHQSGALRYVLMVVDRSTGERVHWDVHHQEDICTGSQCSYTPTIDLTYSNQHVWFVRSWNYTGGSAWVKTVFAYKDDPPMVPVPVAPLNAPATLQPDFQWNNESSASSYVLLIQDTTNNLRLHWQVYSSADICAGIICTVNAPVQLEYDTRYVWYVRARHSTDSSAWAKTIIVTEKPLLKELGPSDITDLILITGQSNVRASQTEYDAALDAIDLRVFAYTGNDDWEVADLHQAWDVDGWHPGNGSLEPYCLANPECTPREPYNNFALHFAKSVVEQDPGRVVGIIIAAAPGEGISHWDQGSAFSQLIESKVLAALNAQGVKSGLDGILWHQGETDWQIEGTSDPDASVADRNNPNYYPEKLNNLLTRFRSSSWFGANRPFICAETRQAPVNQRLMALNTDNDPWTGCVPGSDLTTLEMNLTATPPELGTHFDAPALRTLGARYGLKYIEMTQK